MKRTFKGWLRRYCCDLAGVDTTSLRKLCQTASSRASQANEAVFLYALELGRVSDLCEYSIGSDAHEEWAFMSARSERYFGRAEAFLRECSDRLPVRYVKVLRAFDCIEAGALNDRCVVAQMALQTREALEAAGVSRYRLAKDLSLNEGNVYAWLAGDSTKLARATARRAWKYAMAL